MLSIFLSLIQFSSYKVLRIVYLFHRFITFHHSIYAQTFEN